MNEQEKKYRHELKYIISTPQISLLKSRIVPFMRPDPHVGEKGIYTIRSLYFDDYNNRCFYENENGVDPREKFRIRIYNHSSEHINLECKKKERGKTLKESASLTKELAQQLIDGASVRDIESLPTLIRKMVIQENTLLLKPVIIVEYERIPYIYNNGNVRVTFDTNISSSSACETFWDSELVKRPIMPVGMQLMEVKFDEYLPDFIYHALNINTLRQTAFSKYYLCRKYSIHS
ncbi:MAG: polyphosphate polymerase domain-containing protein [Lachnospiraceae bacterium]|nr:polyphosphate polymerase domain-containing protein [Lachnospiraceae bacterium]